jgi:hypothetical protein
LCKGGRKLTTRAVDEIIKDIEDDRGQRQLMIVILSSNNLRQGSQPPEELMPLFSRIMEKVAATPQCHLVLPSIVPCPTTGRFLMWSTTSSRAWQMPIKSIAPSMWTNLLQFHNAILFSPVLYHVQLLGRFLMWPTTSTRAWQTPIKRDKSV